MRITVLGNFRDPHSTEHHHAQALTDLGHHVLPLQEFGATADGLLDGADGSDLLVWVHTHTWHTTGIAEAIRELRRSGVPTVAYHLDLWHGLDRERNLTADPYFSEVDHFFTVDPGMADWITASTPATGHYLPAAVSHRECWMAPAPRRDLKVAFVGSHNYHPEWPYRNELIARLHMRYGDDFHLIPGRDGRQVRGGDLNRLYGRTQVVVGDTLCPGFDHPGYWSDRVYETLGRGGMLIHPRIKGLDQQFRDREHLAFYDYNDWSTLFDLIDHHLRFPVDREGIRDRGHAEVHRAHTYLHRWQTILGAVL